MKLDAFDQEVLSKKGYAQDLMRELYGAKLSQNTAKTQLSGIRRHLRTKQKLEDVEDNAKGLDERIYHEDGTWTTKRLIMLSEEESQDPQTVMRKMGLDPLQWEVLSFKIKRNWWDVTMKLRDKDGVESPEARRNFQFLVELRLKPTGTISSDVVAQVFRDLKSPVLEQFSYRPGRKMLELPIMDLHLGKLAWAPETGEDYDLKIAKSLYVQTVRDFLGKVAHYNLPIEKIVFPVGQDFFHVDNTTSMTTAGTPVDTDTRWAKMYDMGVQILIWAVEQLRQLAPVEVMYVPGNHDKTLSYCAVYTLNAYYHNCPDVNVDINPGPRKYVRYGVNLVGFSHGKEGKRIFHLMQQERAEDWGETLFREWHLGDLHHEQAVEVGGVKVRRISSVTAADAWHVEKGYRAVRMAQAFVWDRELGLELVIDSNVLCRDGEKQRI